MTTRIVKTYEVEVTVNVMGPDAGEQAKCAVARLEGTSIEGLSGEAMIMKAVLAVVSECHSFPKYGVCVKVGEAMR